MKSLRRWLRGFVAKWKFDIYQHSGVMEAEHPKKRKSKKKWSFWGRKDKKDEYEKSRDRCF